MIDLHLHLDGALVKDDIDYLAKLENVTLPLHYEDHICVNSLCTSLNDYLRCFQVSSEVLQTKRALYEATKRTLAHLASQGLVYVEVRFSPQLHTARGLTQEEAVLAVIQAEKEMKDQIMSGLILCFMRHSLNNAFNYETIRVAKKYLNKGVDAVDLAGAESLYQTEEFAPLFAMVQDDQIPSTIHAGEADGPASVEAALAFHAARIGHGVRAIYSEETMKKIIEKQIPLEVCLTSEVQTKAVPSLDQHPFRKLMNMGCLLTINTDDPAISNIDLAGEYKLLKDNFSLTKEEAFSLMMNAVECSFRTYDEKKKIRQKIESGFEQWWSQKVK